MKPINADPKPFMIAGYAVIVLTFGVVGGWAATAKLDKAIVAPGTVDIATNRKEIQHLEGGIIDKIFVHEGQSVKAGEVLIQLNDIQARANVQVVSMRLHISQAVEARLQAERILQDTPIFPKVLLDDKTPEVVTAISDQRQIFADRMSILKSQIDILTNRISQFKREAQGFGEQKEAFKTRTKMLSERLDRLKNGLSTGAIQKNVYTTYENEYIDVKSNVARMDTEQAKAEKSIGETQFQILQTQQTFKERASSEYKDESGKTQELIEQLKVAEDSLKRTKIRSPVDGVAQNLQLNGPVVRAGQVLLEVVPITDEMVINAHVATTDIDSVREGMEAEIKFNAFPSRLMPLITGKVTTVSKASITPSDGRTAPYYLARIDVGKGMIPENLKGRLSAGMPAEVLISAGERSVLSYLTSPLTDMVWKSMKEK